MRARNKTRPVCYSIIDGGPWFYAVLAFRTASVCEEFAWSLEGGACFCAASNVSKRLAFQRAHTCSQTQGFLRTRQVWSGKCRYFIGSGRGSLNGSRAPPIQAVLQVHSLTYMNYTRVTTSVSQTSRP